MRDGVMPGLVPGIHVLMFRAQGRRSRGLDSMPTDRSPICLDSGFAPSARPGMTKGNRFTYSRFANASWMKSSSMR
jgi:hypothetical protein